MPCPHDLTARQCAIRDHIAKRLEKRQQQGEFQGNPWAVATAHVEKMRDRKKAKHG